MADTFTLKGDINALDAGATFSGTVTVTASKRFTLGNSEYPISPTQATVASDGQYTVPNLVLPDSPNVSPQNFTYRLNYAVIVTPTTGSPQIQAWQRDVIVTSDLVEAGVIEVKKLPTAQVPGSPSPFLSKQQVLDLIEQYGGGIDPADFVSVSDLTGNVADLVYDGDLATALGPINTELGKKVNSLAFTTAISTLTDTANGAASTASAAAAAVAGKADVAATLGITVLPSGDTTGVTDLAAINNAFNSAFGTPGVTLKGTYYTLGTIKIPSNRTLTLWDAEVRRINDKGSGTYTSNSVFVSNSEMNATGNQNIAVRGIGKASFRLHTGSASYVRQPDEATYSISNYFGFFFVNVNGLVVQDVSIGPSAAFTSNIQVCKNVVYRNVTCAQDRLHENQDGLDIGPGCSNVTFDGVYGVTSDDAFSLYAQNTSGSLHPYTKTLTNAQRNVTDITIQNVVMDVGINVFRMQAGDGSTLARCSFSNIVNTRPGQLGVNGDKSAVLKFGRVGYVAGPPSVDGSQFQDISLNGYRGTGTHLIGADSNFRDVRVSGFSMKDVETLIGWEEKGLRNNAGTFQPTYSKIKIDDGKLIGTGATEPTIMGMTAGTATDVTISNVNAETLKYVTRNTVLAGGYTHSVTNLNLSNITAAQITGAMFGSTIQETGRANRLEALTVGSSYSGTYRGASVKLALAGTPVGRAGDLVPAPTAGSRLLCSGLNPVGDSFAGPAAEYLADGVAWNRTYTLANAIPGGVVAPSAAPVLSAGTPAQTTIPLSLSYSGSDATGYRYQVKNAGAADSTYVAVQADTTSQSINAGGLTASTSYSFRAAAVNSGGVGPWSNTVTVSTAAAGSKTNASDAFAVTSSSGIPNWAFQATSTDESLVDANGAGLNRASGSSAASRWYAAPTAPTTNQQWGEVEIKALGTATAVLAPIVSLRSTMVNNNGTLLYTQYFARYTAGTGVVIFKVVDSGSATTIGTYSTTLAAGAKLRFRVQGSATTTLDLSFDEGATWVGNYTDSSSPITQIGNVWLGFRWAAVGDNAQRARAMKWGDV